MTLVECYQGLAQRRSAAARCRRCRWACCCAAEPLLMQTHAGQALIEYMTSDQRMCLQLFAAGLAQSWARQSLRARRLPACWRRRCRWGLASFVARKLILTTTMIDSFTMPGFGGRRGLWGAVLHRGFAQASPASAGLGARPTGLR